MHKNKNNKRILIVGKKLGLHPKFTLGLHPDWMSENNNTSEDNFQSWNKQRDADLNLDEL